MKQLWMILLLFTPSKKTHMAKIRRFIKGFIKEWAQNIAKKVSFIQDRTTIHGEYHIYKDRKVCIKPLRNRIEAILKLEPPKCQKV